MKRFSIIFGALFFILPTVRANEPDLELSFGEPEIYSEEIEEIPQEYLQLKLTDVVLPIPKPGPITPFPGKGTINPDKIVQIGKVIWDFIKENRAIVDLEKNVAHVVPEGVTQWEQLSGWSDPKNYMYKVSYKNGYGVNVVNLKYYVLYTPNGGHEGVGQYLANVTVMPAEMTASWGYTVNARTNIHRALNVGTSEDPIANVLMDITWSVSTVVKKSIESLTFSLSGNGRFQEIGSESIETIK
ncbi:hypothetical protein GW915_05235 [bacterium]|nr:hypothetical protein [bacterium]